MKSAVFHFTEKGWERHGISQLSHDNEAQLVLCFGAKKRFEEVSIFFSLQQKFSAAQLLICSSAGEIFQDVVLEDALVAVALQFDKTTIQGGTVNIKDFASSYDAATALVKKMPQEDLAYLLVFSDGSLVNGSQLVNGLNAAVDSSVKIAGALAGDGDQFESTLVGFNEAPAQGNIAAIGFYGKDIALKFGYHIAADSFGLEKIITRSTDNVLMELEGQNALELYKKYLGSESKNLPGSALLFPLSLIVPGTKKPVIRTILSIDEEAKTMTFSGDVPEGSKVRFMKTSSNNLITSASFAAQQVVQNVPATPCFALLISCVGRKLLLKSRIDEEVEVIKNVFGAAVVMAGFYSYGEICPAHDCNHCQLHNQSMTITTFCEL